MSYATASTMITRAIGRLEGVAVMSDQDDLRELLTDTICLLEAVINRELDENEKAVPAASGTARK